MAPCNIVVEVGIESPILVGNIFCHGIPGDVAAAFLDGAIKDVFVLEEK
jgi:hypothetical protein